jgi:hypothetical protein
MNDQHLFEATEKLSHRSSSLREQAPPSHRSSSLNSHGDVQHDASALPNSIASLSLRQDNLDSSTANPFQISMDTRTSTSLFSMLNNSSPFSAIKHPRNPISSSTAVVIHSYTDYADVPEELQELPPEVDENNNVVKRNTGGVSTTFPERLHQLLTENKFSDIVCWMPHGRCFKVTKTKEFETLVMSAYFTHTKITSFQRQLNLYGFKRITKGPDRGSYYHELFLRGMPKLCTRMRRQKVKGTGTKPLPDPENEPNFYVMKSVPDVRPHESLKINNSGLSVAKTEDEIISPAFCSSNGIPQMPPTNSAALLQPRDESKLCKDDGKRSAECEAMIVRPSVAPQNLWIGQKSEFGTFPGEVLHSRKKSLEGNHHFSNEPESPEKSNRRQSIEFARELWRSTYTNFRAPNPPNTWATGKHVEVPGLAHSKVMQPTANEAEDSAAKMDRRRYVEFAQNLSIANEKYDTRDHVNRGGGAIRRRSFLLAPPAHTENEQPSASDFKIVRKPSITRGSVRRLSHARLSITSLGNISQMIQVAENKIGRRASTLSWESSASLDFDEDLTDAFQKRMSLVSIASSFLNFKDDQEDGGASERRANSDGSCAWVEDEILNRRHSFLTELDYDNLFNESDVASV